MNVDDAIKAAVAAFTDWRRPSAFYTEVVNTLNPEACPRFEIVWQMATDSAYWTSGDLGECAKFCASALAVQFPHLSEATIRDIVNAAAFLWR